MYGFCEDIELFVEGGRKCMPVWLVMSNLANCKGSFDQFFKVLV